MTNKIQIIVKNGYVKDILLNGESLVAKYPISAAKVTLNATDIPTLTLEIPIYDYHIEIDDTTLEYKIRGTNLNKLPQEILKQLNQAIKKELT